MAVDIDRPKFGGTFLAVPRNKNRNLTFVLGGNTG